VVYLALTEYGSSEKTAQLSLILRFRKYMNRCKCHANGAVVFNLPADTSRSYIVTTTRQKGDGSFMSNSRHKRTVPCLSSLANGQVESWSRGVLYQVGS